MRAQDIQFTDRYQPFCLSPRRPEAARSLTSGEGVADRLRLVAFAELQARDLFRYGCERFVGQVPENWVADWARFAEVEERHAQMLLDRMQELGVDLGARMVSDKLSRLCRGATDPVLFLFLLSSAEERGMEAGAILGEQMRSVDSKSAEVFAQIAREEEEHVASARAALREYQSDSLRERARALSALI